jgi:hypothetical protein
MVNDRNEIKKQQIREKVAAHFAEDNVSPDEVILRDDGKVVLDRRKTYPRAIPIVVAEWS